MISITPQTVLLFLWQASWQAACLLGCASLLSTWLPGARSRARLWHAAILGCGIVPLVSGLLPHYILLNVPLPAGVPFVDAADFTTAPTGNQRLTWIATALVLIWMTGCGFHAAHIFYGWLKVRRVLSISAPLECQRLQELLQRNGRVKHLEVRILPALESPFCWQIHRPVLILPENLLCRTDEDLELLLRHEMAHLHAGDPCRLFVEHCIQAVFWFHPLVCRALRQAQCWREIASDDWALAAGGSPLRLGRLLTELAEQAARPRYDAWQLSAQGSTSDLQLRLRRMVGQRPSSEESAAIRGGIWAVMMMLTLSFAIVRLAGPFALPGTAQWTHWPRFTGQLLDLAGVRVVDFDLRRAAHDPREQTPEHRAAHRQWRRP